MKLKHLLMLTPVSTIVSLPLISASPNDPSTPPTPEQPQTPPDLNKVKQKQTQLIKDEFLKSLNKVQSDLINAINKINDLSPKPLSNELLVKQAYYKKVINYLDSNKDKIVENPSAYGFDFIFPSLLTSQDFYFGDIKYNNEDFTNLMIGKIAQNDYKITIPLHEGNEIKIENKELSKNSISEDAILKTTQTYIENLAGEVEKIFVNSDDVPKLETDTEFQLQDNSQYDLKVPNNYDTWDAYIKDKIQKRFLAYDLEQNQQFNEPEDQPQDPTVPIQPVILDEDEVDPLPFEVNLENVPRLSPTLNFDIQNLSNQEVVNLFKANEQVFNKKNIWWANPILSSFEYKITDLKVVNNTLTASVSLVETTNPSNSTQYEIAVQKYASQQENASYKLAFENFKKQYQMLLQAVGISDKLDYAASGNSKIAQSLFNQTFLAVKLINDKHFLEMLSKVIGSYEKNTKITLNNDTLENDVKNDSLSQESKEFLTSSLTVQEINQYKFYNYLATQYENLYTDLLNQNAKNTQVIEQNFKLLNLDENRLKSAFKTLNTKIRKFKTIATENNLSFADYQQYTLELKDIHTSMLTIGTLTKNAPLQDSQSDEAKLFLESYNKLELNAPKTLNANDFIVIAFGVVTVVGALLMVLVWLVKHFWNKKQIKDKNDK